MSGSCALRYEHFQDWPHARIADGSEEQHALKMRVAEIEERCEVGPGQELIYHKHMQMRTKYEVHRAI